MPDIGGFSFRVAADLSAAVAAFQRLQQQASQTAQQIQSGFRAAQVNVDTRAAEQSIDRLAQKTRQLSQQGSATFAIRTTGAEETSAAFDRLTTKAREAGALRLNLQVRADGSEQAQRSIEQMAQALRAVRAGERITIQVRTENLEHADSAVRQLTADIERARQAGARVAVNVTQTTTGDGAGGGFASGLAGGAFRGVLRGTGVGEGAIIGAGFGAAAAGAALATAAVANLIRAMGDVVSGGVALNAQMEQAAVTFRVFTGSTTQASAALQQLRRYADVTPFNDEEVIRSGQVFARVTGGNLALMQRFVELAGQLAAVNPETAAGGGFGGATRAIQEALGGDFTSAQARFDIPRDQIQRIRDAGLTGVELAEALVKAAGGSKALVDALGQTFTGRLTTTEAALNRLREAATKPLFDFLADELGKLNTTLEQNGPAWAAWAESVGQALVDVLVMVRDTAKALNDFGNAVADVLSLPNRLGRQVNAALGGPGQGGLPAFGGVTTAGVLSGNLTGPPARPAPAPTELTAADQAQQASSDAANARVNQANQALERQKTINQEIGKQLEQNAALAAVITEVYQAQLRPLEEQSRALAEQERAAAAVQRGIADRAARAEAPVAIRAQAAFDTTILDHEQEIVSIRQRRAEITEQLGAAERAVANDVAEAQIRGQERALQATQQRAQAESQARQDTLDGIREEIRGRQEARQAALEGLRDLIQAQQQQRRDVLEGIQEEIRSRRDAYDLARQTAQDARDDARDAFQEQEHQSDRVHSAVMEHYRDQIDSLQQQAQASREIGKSRAEQSLAALDASEREYALQQRLNDARRAVNEATTLRGQIDARRALGQVEHQVSVEHQRAELQARIEKEREDAERRRQAIAEHIQQLERAAREEDRRYQHEKDAREEAFRQQQRAEAIQQRNEERAEQARRRQEDARVRAEEKADREQQRAEQAQLQAAERAARAADRADAAQLRNEERAAREADRAAQREILQQQQAIQTARNTLSDANAAAQAQRDLDALARLRESAALDQRRLEIRERIATAEDTGAKAAAARDKVIADEHDRRLALQRAANDAEIASVKARQEAALAPIEAQRIALDLNIKLGKLAVDELQRRVDEAKAALAELNRQAQAAGARAPASIVDTRAADQGAHEGGRPGPGPLAGIGVPDLSGALDELSNLPIFDPAFWLQTGQKAAEDIWQGILDQFSPSVAHAEELDQNVDQITVDVGEHWAGVADQIEAQREQIEEAIAAPFDPTGVRGVVDEAVRVAAEAWAKLDEEIAQEGRRIEQALERPFLDFQRRDVPEITAAFAEDGYAAGRAWERGWIQANIHLAIANDFTRIIKWIGDLCPAFTQTGANLATQLQNGWQTAMAGWRPSVPTPAAGGGGGNTFSTGQGGNQGHFVTSRPGEAPWWWNPDDPNSATRRSPTPYSYPRIGTGAQQPLARAAGGAVWPFQEFLVGEHGPEIARFPRAGAILPADLTARALSATSSGAAAAGGGRGVTVTVNGLTVNVSGVSGDPVAIARAVAPLIVNELAAGLEHAQLTAPTPVSRNLPGALGS